MTYDDAGWHTDSVKDLGLPEEAAGTHISMFMAWLALHDLVSEKSAARARGLRDRSITPDRYLFDSCCGEINAGWLNETGREFTAAAYKHYLAMYEYFPPVAAFDSTYETPASWETYDAIAGEIDGLFHEWRRSRGYS